MPSKPWKWGPLYNDAGATAADAVDGDLTANIVTGGLPIDTSAVGSHTVTYDVSDSSGNAAVPSDTNGECGGYHRAGDSRYWVMPSKAWKWGPCITMRGPPAADAVDGDLTASIVTGGLPIDTSAGGQPYRDV